MFDEVKVVRFNVYLKKLQVLGKKESHDLQLIM